MMEYKVNAEIETAHDKLLQYSGSRLRGGRDCWCGMWVKHAIIDDMILFPRIQAALTKYM